MGNNASILSTVQLEQPLIDRAMLAGMDLDIIPFIQIVDISDSSELQEKIGQLYKEKITVIFTSTNAVYAICEHPSFGQPDWDIYCIENATMKAVLEYFPAERIMGKASDSDTLATEILKNKNIKNITFFCGDKRMDTLPDALQKGKVVVNEVVVYTTVETPVFAAKDYDGILFNSPSAVSSFFSMNLLDEHTVVFAIGKSTAKSLEKECNNQLIISDIATKKGVLETAIRYFEQHKTNQS